MRIAVFADVHGNPYACRAVLGAIRDDGAPDAIVAAGDLCLGGSDPSACIDLLREAGALAIYGNTEAYLLAPDQAPPDKTHLKNWDWIQPAVYWTLEQLRPDQIDWLGALPFERRFSPGIVGDSPKGDLLVVHANPCNLELMIYPDEAGQKKLWGEVRQPNSDPALASVLEGVSAGVLAFGHFHYTFQRSWRNLKLVDVGPCSHRSYDHDLRARYTLFTSSADGSRRGRHWKIEHRWVEYDAQQENTAVWNSSMPGREHFVSNFG